VEKSPELTAPAPSRRWWRLGGAVALAILVAAAAWLVTGLIRTDDSQETSVDRVGPIGLTADGLRTLAGSVGQPIYWAGPDEGYIYELRRNAKGHVFIRYLPQGVEVGAPEDEYLVVATYPYKSAYNALQNVTDGEKYDIPRGGVALVDARTANSVHVAYPGLNYQVEIYDPSPERALEVARSGDVRVVR